MKKRTSSDGRFFITAGEGENPLGSPGEDSETRPDLDHGLESAAAGPWPKAKHPALGANKNDYQQMVVFAFKLI